MSKRIYLIMILISMVTLSGCVPTKASHDKEPVAVGRFQTIEKTSMWRIVVDSETKVMYAVSNCAYNVGTFTLLVDADGKPLLWEGDADMREGQDE